MINFHKKTTYFYIYDVVFFEKVFFHSHVLSNSKPQYIWKSYINKKCFTTFTNETAQNAISNHMPKVMRQSANELPAPSRGCYIRGLFMEGAKWDLSKFRLDESRSKELYTTVPCIWLKPTLDRKIPFSGIYECPVYKTLKRAGEASLVLLK